MIDYELLDCGGFKKLERFGEYTLIRPEPQAIWDSKWDLKKWKELSHAEYVAKTSNSGEWQKFKAIKNPWFIHYNSPEFNLKFKLNFTAFKHIGIFPEQAENWEILHKFIVENPSSKMLNLFAYTGGASLAGKAAGADVVHLDSVKQVVSWARENMELSGLNNIRWVVEDALKFVQRETKRGAKYQAIVLDPPSYGLGPNGERWKLEDNLNELMKNVLTLLDEKSHCLILNTYSLNLSPTILKNILVSNYKGTGKIEIGELKAASKTGFELPLGSYLRVVSS